MPGRSAHIPCMELWRRTNAALTVAAVTALTSACGSDPSSGPTAPVPTADPTAETEATAPQGQIDRRTLDLVLLKGPVWLLRRIPIEEVLHQGEFVGWRIRELPDQWSEVDLQPGDVITAINDQPVEKPNDFWAVWATLGTAKELKVAYQRYGEASELTIPIWGEPDPRISQRLDEQRPRPPSSKTIGGSPAGRDDSKLPPPAAAGREPKRKPTIVIRPPSTTPPAGW